MCPAPLKKPPPVLLLGACLGLGIALAAGAQRPPGEETPPPCPAMLAIGMCDTGIRALREDGSCLQEAVDRCVRESKNHGQLVSCVAALKSRLPPADAQALMRCVAAPQEKENRPPAIECKPVVAVTAGEVLTEKVKATDPDADKVELKALGKLPANAELAVVDNNTDKPVGTLTFKPAADQVGRHVLRFQATDEHKLSQQARMLAVVRAPGFVNKPPRITQVEVVELDAKLDQIPTTRQSLPKGKPLGGGSLVEAKFDVAGDLAVRIRVRAEDGDGEADWLTLVMVRLGGAPAATALNEAPGNPAELTVTFLDNAVKNAAFPMQYDFIATDLAGEKAQVTVSLRRP